MTTRSRGQAVIRAAIGWLLGIFRRREHLPAPDARCQRGIERDYMNSLKRRS